MFEPTAAQIAAAVSAIHDYAVVPADPAQRHRLFAALDVLNAVRRAEQQDSERAYE
ncbi:hypothetical protein [Streptomyces kurssanovii]|uniref:Uncharacterized protein n=1 Tax=Streptomyces kurssanovii TaxID=67312 RepID=A0ABV3HZZ1_9ACTN